jgi:hypothetical protein
MSVSTYFILVPSHEVCELLYEGLQRVPGDLVKVVISNDQQTIHNLELSCSITKNNIQHREQIGFNT